MTRYRVHVVEESVLKAVVDAPPEVDKMTQEQRREWLTEAALALADDASEPECFDCYYGTTDFWPAAPVVRIDGEQVSCEKCWDAANRRVRMAIGRADETYWGMLKSPEHAGHTEDEQTGWTPC